MKKQLLAVPAVLFIAMSLAACGGSNGASSGDADNAAPASQTVEEACKVAEDEMNAFSAKYEEAASNLGTDSEAAVTMLKDMTAEIAAVGDKIGNAEVSAAWDGFVVGFEKLASASESADIQELTDATTGMMEAAEAIGALCPTATE